jgi:hypothetical protein
MITNPRVISPSDMAASTARHSIADTKTPSQKKYSSLPKRVQKSKDVRLTTSSRKGDENNVKWEQLSEVDKSKR